MTKNRFLRQWQIIGDKRRGIEPIIPVSRSTWLLGCESGLYPKPVKLGPRCNVWHESDIDAVIEGTWQASAR